jgi:peptidoglycan/LPS O-acetylase OafA/YrhL
MTRAYLPFVDWMKAVGLGLIVLGHVAHNAIALATPPFYPKQLGVAFFVFASGYTLASERRPPLQAIVTRWFEVGAYGLLFALLLTAIDLGLGGNGNPSNYLPLAGGLNVLFNDFPANPTTWYIGTYLHLLVVWALVFRGRQLRVRGLLLAAAVEIVVRAVLAQEAGLFVAYQALFNWLTVLALGLYAGQQQLLPRARNLVLELQFVIWWPIAMWALGWTQTFPFMTSALAGPAWNAWLLSVCVTTAYVCYTISAFTLLGRLPDSRVVRFFARNTLIVFIAHMPVFYLLQALLDPSMPYAARAAIAFVVCFVGLAAVSELIRPLLQPVLQAARGRLLQLSAGIDGGRA